MLSNTQNPLTALNKLADEVQSNPDGFAGLKIRQFLWSAFKPDHLISISKIAQSVPPNIRNELTDVFAAVLNGTLTQDELRSALVRAKEFPRFESCTSNGRAIALLEEVEQLLIDILVETPPSREHIVVNEAMASLATVKDRMIRNS